MPQTHRHSDTLGDEGLHRQRGRREGRMVRLSIKPALGALLQMSGVLDIHQFRQFEMHQVWGVLRRQCDETIPFIRGTSEGPLYSLRLGPYARHQVVV